MPSVNELLQDILLATSEGTGAGFLMPDSATYPFASDSARDTWATSNKEDLVKNSTVVNVSSTIWYVWRGEDNPASYDSANWSDVTPIIKGEQGAQGEAGGATVEAQVNELTTYDQVNEKFVGSGVFAENGELVVSTSTISLGGAYSISSGGESVAIKNIPKNETNRIVSDNFLAIEPAKRIVNRLSTGPVVPTPDDSGNVINPDYQQEIIPFLNPAEDGQVVSYVEFKFDASSVMTNIKISVFLNGILFAENFFPTIPEVEPGIYRLTYESPIDAEVGDVFRGTISSVDGDVIVKGNATTGAPWQRLTLIAWDYKAAGLKDHDIESVDLSVSSGVLTTELTKFDGTLLSDSVTINGTSDVIEYNVDDDFTVTLGNSVVGKTVSITQTNLVATAMIFTLEDHANFSTGDTIKIITSLSYISYFFGVIYSLSNGEQRALYPNNSIELVRTDSGWDVIQDGSVIRTAIVTAGNAGNALVGNEASIQSVQSISAVENDAVSILDDGNGHRTLQFDLNQIEPTSLADNAPYRIYKSIAEIEADFGPITFAALDGVNDDQIRANNALTLIDAIGDLAMADLTIGSDLTISPIEYVQLVVNSKSDERVSITAVSKKTSDFWLFSGELSDAGGNTTSRWEQLHRNGKALNMGGNTIQNLATGGADSDAVTKLQSENYVNTQFGKANDTGADLAPYEVDLKDSSRDAGYGSTISGEIGKITYFGVSDNQVVNPDLSYGKMFYIHLSVSGERGYWMIHESLLSDFVTSSTQEIPFSVGEVEVGLGKNNQVAPDVVHDASAIWNCTGGAIKNTDNANTLPPTNNYYDKQEVEGGAVKRNDAMSALYTAGKLEIVFDELTRGNVKNISDLSAEFIADPTSEWFAVKAVKKGSTFTIKKLFMLLPYEYAYTFYSTVDNAIAFGLKVGDNRERILELEKQVSELTPVAQDEDDNGLAETIMMPAHIIKEIEIDVGETKTLDIGYENNQVNLLAYEIFIKSLETDVNNINYGRNFEVKGALIKSNGSFSFVKSQATGESLNLVVSASMVDEHIQVSLSGAPCKLSINTKAVVKR